MVEVLIIGGGLAGLVNAILLNRAGIGVLLVERHHYPMHRVCGEYVSAEVSPFLQRHGLYPDHLELPIIRKLVLTSVSGRKAETLLDLGGFGISRYAFDDFLYGIALREGVRFLLDTQVTGVRFLDNRFEVELSDHSIVGAELVIGAQGKRSKLDSALERKFMAERTDYIGVKYHIRTDFHVDSVALHNFSGGYCGLSRVEGGIYNLCYLGRRSQLRRYGTVPELERNVLWRNPFLRDIFSNSEFLFDKPLVINEFSFSPKKPVERNILMSGDAAGLITPLCGNGMALAIHSAALLSTIIASWKSDPHRERARLEERYRREWINTFAPRLWVGRRLQGLFGGETTSTVAVDMLRYSPPLAHAIIRRTHGRPF